MVMNVNLEARVFHVGRVIYDCGIAVYARFADGTSVKDKISWYYHVYIPRFPISYIAKGGGAIKLFRLVRGRRVKDGFQNIILDAFVM